MVHHGVKHCETTQLCASTRCRATHANVVLGNDILALLRPKDEELTKLHTKGTAKAT